MLTLQTLQNTSINQGGENPNVQMEMNSALLSADLPLAGHGLLHVAPRVSLHSRAGRHLQQELVMSLARLHLVTFAASHRPGDICSSYQVSGQVTFGDICSS